MPEARPAAAAPGWLAGERAALRQLDELTGRKQFRRALAAASEAARRLPGSARLHGARGRIAEHLVSSDPDRSASYSATAVEAYSEAQRIDRGDPEAAAGLARALDRRGDVDAARAVLAPHLVQPVRSAKVAAAFAAIAGRTGEAELAVSIAGDFLSGDPDRDDIVLLHATARLLDRLGRHDEAFRYARLGNEAFVRRQLGKSFRTGELGRTADTLIAATPRAAMLAMPPAAHYSELPVFIVGMGRSGTTLVEQIVAGHPAAHGAGERRALANTVKQLARSTGIGYAEGASAWPAEAVDQAAATYLERLAALAPDARRITDKLPQNFLRLPLIQRMLPGARVIHCQRNPLDVCISAYFQQDKVPAAETWDLYAAGVAYRDYERLMAHWARVLDLPVLTVQYEHLTERPETEARRIIAFLGLEWDPVCLETDRNRRVVDTSNYAAVHRPIHGEAVGRWKRYRRQIDPLIDALNGKPAPASG
ncbi:MAG: sulfotransferase [Alphaproteobacteria bacterium]